MPTNLSIDDQLLNEAVKISGLRTKKDTVNQTLKELVERRRQQESVRRSNRRE